MRGTVEAIERELLVDGFVAALSARRGRRDVDGLPPRRGRVPRRARFWLADNLALLGPPRGRDGAFERLLGLRNDVGLLAEEYDVGLGRQLGNFPQAFSHVGLVNAAVGLSR